MGACKLEESKHEEEANRVEEKRMQKRIVREVGRVRVGTFHVGFAGRRAFARGGVTTATTALHSVGWWCTGVRQ